MNGKTEYWGNSYGYDPWGNLLQKSVTKCSAENLSVSALSNNQLSGYGYDAAGNMTHDATTNVNYTFDQENRIIGAAGYTYTYDADGNRVEKSNGSTGTIYWYMSPGIVAESDLSGNLKSEYVFFDGERVARKDFSGSTTSVSYYFSDHLRTASVITNSAGVITEDEDYYPWGGELQFVNSDLNHYKFTGKERDSETGLDYFGARYYGNWYGRFLSADWSAKPEAVPYSDLHDPQSLNLYSYVRNIPTSKADADGHDPPGAGGAVATAAAACAASAPCATVAVVSAPIAAPSVLAMTVAVSLPPMQNTPDGSPNLILDALNPPYVPAPTVPTTNPGTTTKVDTNTPASTSQTGAVSTSTAQSTKETGSYTNTHASGKTYSGKGSRARSQASGKRVEKQTGDKHTATDWTQSANDREAFKDESQRIDANGGANSSGNYNQRESPGKNYKKQDGPD